MEFRVMTYNIQHGLDYNRQLAGNTGLSHEIDLTQIVGVIRSLNPDVVGLNEVRGLGPQWDYTAQAETLAAMLGWHCYFAPAIWFEGEYPYGNAILSRRPLLSAQRILIPDPPVRDEDAYYETRCILRAEVANGPVMLISHFGLAKSEQRNAVSTMLDLLAKETGPAVVMGDFNMEPNDPILAPLLSATEDAGAQLTHPGLSWPSDKPEMKIDYILTKGAKVLSADVPAIVAADHRPHIATIELPD